MEGGGAERVAALLSNRWAEQGHEVLLVPTFSGRGTCLYALDERVRLEYLADRVGTTRKSPWFLARRLWAMRAMSREFRADVVLSFLTHVNVAALLATRGLRVRTVVAERTYPPAMDVGPVWPKVRRISYPWASKVVMQTSLGLTWLAGDLPRVHGVVIPNPCLFPLPSNEPRLEPEAVVANHRRLLVAAGRLGEEKGFNLLIKAFKALASRFTEWDLAILGEGAKREALEEQVATAGLTGRVFLPGRVGNLGDWYERADLYAMSSRFEGFPNALLEALSYGVPAVSFDCETGPADLIETGRNGYLVAPEEGAAGLAKRLAPLMADENLRRDMGKRAAEVRERYSLVRVGAEWDRALGLVE